MMTAVDATGAVLACLRALFNDDRTAYNAVLAALDDTERDVVLKVALGMLQASLESACKTAGISTDDWCDGALLVQRLHEDRT